MSNIRKARIAYTGEALNDGTMPVKELAPALLAFAELVENSYRAIGGTQKVKVLLNQDSINRGSFDITFILNLDIMSQIHLFVSNSKENGLDDLMTVLGWIETTAGVTALAGNGVFKLIKAIKGRKIKNIEDAGKDASTITLSDGDKLTVDRLTLKVFMDAECRANIERIIQPIRDGVAEGFQLRNPLDLKDSEPIVNVSQSDSILFKAPPVEEEEYEATSQKQNMIASIVTVNFNDGKWRLSDGTNTFRATIADEKFLQQIEDGDISFCKGDHIQMDYYMEQKMKDGKLSSEYIVTKVNTLIKRPRQVKLDLC